MSEYKLTLLYKKGLDYKTRNFIALIVILILTNISSFLLQKNLKQRFEEYKVENSKLTNNLASITNEINSEGPLLKQLERLQEELFLTDKVMADKNNTTITLTHLFNIFRKYNNYLFFDFRHISSGTHPDDDEVNYQRYGMTGSTYSNLLYVFIDQFERQPSFYTIESLELSSSPPEERGKVNFDIEFHAYFTKSGIPYEQVKLQDLKRRTLPYNIFYHRIYDPFVLESDAELMEIEHFTIIGLTQEQVFVRNRVTGTVQTLIPGDRIKNGSLTAIDWQTQQAVFRLNRTGLAELVRLKPE